MVNFLKKFLFKNGYVQQKELFEDLFMSHPNYPSIYAITDSLNMLNIENVAVKIPKEQFINLPPNFLAVFNNDIVLASKTTKEIILNKDNEKDKRISYNDFLNGWNEVIVAIEPNTTNESNKIKLNINYLLYSFPFLTLLYLSISNFSYNLHTATSIFIDFIGLFFSIAILQEKYGVKNEFASKLCSLNTNTSCSSVIQSKHSNYFNWFSIAELPFLFYCIGIISMLIDPFTNYYIMGYLNIIALPGVIYSIYLQKSKIKKWCILCLLVSFLILLQSLLFLTTNLSMQKLNILDFVSFSLLGISSIITWKLVKPLIEKTIQNTSENFNLKRFKYNYEIFNFLSKDIKNKDEFKKLQPIVIGSPDALLSLTLILSPSCGHCHKAFQDGLDLINNFPSKLNLNILFNLNPENQDNIYKEIVEICIELNKHNPEKVKEALLDWHIKRINLEEWLQKWKTSKINQTFVNQQIQEQYEWCVKGGLNFTPIKIINQKFIPSEYEISELKFFINQIIETL